MTFLPLPGQYIEDTDGFPPPLPGQINSKFAQITFAVSSGTAIFFLPNLCEIVDMYVVVSTAFNAGGTNTLDVGISGTQTKFVSGLSVAATGKITTGVVAAQFGVKQSGIQVVTVRYNQTSTAANAGVATVFINYIVR